MTALLRVTKLSRIAVVASLILPVALLGGLAGCSKTAPPDTSDVQQVRELIVSTPKAAQAGLDSLQALCTSSMKVSEEQRAKLAAMPVDVASTPVINNDAADVLVYTYDKIPDRETGRFSWSVVKEGGVWKIRTLSLSNLR
jgi:hypothetical protein